MFNKILVSITYAILMVILLTGFTTSANFDIAPYNANKVSSNEKNWFLINVKAGQKIRQSLAVSNDQNQDINLEMNAKDATILEDGSFTIIPDKQQNLNTGNWLNLDVNKIIIPAQKLVQIPFSIDIPNDTKDGEYAAGISAFETKPNVENVQTVIRKGVRAYIAVGDDFKLNSKVDKLNILDPKDTNFEDIKTKKSYFGKDNALLEFEVENTGNIFGILEAKYALKYDNGEVFEGNFSTEIAPFVGKRTFYIITNQAYRVGNTEAILDYKIKPLNIDPKRVMTENITGVLNDNLNLSQNQLDNFLPAKTAAFKEVSKSQLIQPEDSVAKNIIDRLKIIIPISFLVLLAFGLVGWYFIYKKRNERK